MVPPPGVFGSCRQTGVGSAHELTAEIRAKAATIVRLVKLKFINSSKAGVCHLGSIAASLFEPKFDITGQMYPILVVCFLAA
jgi:hypothetical protein